MIIKLNSFVIICEIIMQILFSNVKCLTGCSIEIPIMGSGGNIGLILKIGTRRASLFFSLNIQSEYSYITDKNFNREDFKNSTSLGKRNITVDNINTIAELLEDDLFFSQYELTVPQFHLYFLNETFKKIAQLSLSYNSQFDEYSLIRLFKDNNIIDSYIFTLTIDENQFGRINFGEINKNDLKGPYKGECNIQEDEWKCLLKTARVNNKTIYNTKSYAKFNIDNNIIKVPKEVYDYIGEHVFKPYIEEKKCSFHQVYNDENFYNCFCSSIEDFPDFNFEIGNYLYTIKYYDLFWQYDGFCTFLIEENKNSNDFLFGSTFFIKYQSIFNYENKKITFLTNFRNEIEFVYDQYHKTKVMLCLSDGIILLLSVIGLIINKIVATNNNIPS